MGEKKKNSAAYSLENAAIGTLYIVIFAHCCHMGTMYQILPQKCFNLICVNVIIHAVEG